MNWASVAATAAPVAAPAAPTDGPKPRIAVVDANALITQHGLLNLARFSDKCITTPEVLREVRDKQSRASLAALPFAIDTQEPAEDSVKAVVKFARATGDIHALSSADVRLIALAHGLEVAAHGGGHLHELPQMPTLPKKRVIDRKLLPGWGVEGGDWAEIDRLNEEEEAAAEAALGGGASRIASEIQALSLDDAVAAAAAAGGAPDGGAGAADGAGSEGDESEEESGDDDEEWETAAKSGAAARKKKRKEARKAAWEARQAAAAGAAAGGEQGEEQEEEGGEEEEEGEEDEGEEDYEGADACSLASDDDATAVSAAPTAPAAGGEGGGAGGGGGQEQEQADGRQFVSTVCILTADFAMQNVIMQMGLRLVTPDGRRITRLSRWVLRCTACFLVTKEMGRLFCPRCGNATLDKVQLVVGPDGSEQYGVKRKHILRGTRFSLPKPRGGRHRDLILREDQLLAKAHRLRKKKEKEELDPFAPEYGQDTWHQAAGLHYGNKGAAALMAGWKNNPNERKHIATNRRRNRGPLATFRGSL
ncbi:RNA-binding NOB1 [Micractinium conductrix]|uniref:RNA-binding NOB1 n=1 Tax=Micractinium conductrix TaxID=554055 RepID=A0A2P6VIN9_9CHLO|nr:RNA-binding NOB1 [Micractinium conductrix]|eukprot:PSC73917.1 RNA-binding NOB1 [Micractinium conductrix]